MNNVRLRYPGGAVSSLKFLPLMTLLWIAWPNGAIADDHASSIDPRHDNLPASATSDDRRQNQCRLPDRRGKWSGRPIKRESSFAQNSQGPPKS